MSDFCAFAVTLGYFRLSVVFFGAVSISTLHFYTLQARRGGSIQRCYEVFEPGFHFLSVDGLGCQVRSLND